MNKSKTNSYGKLLVFFLVAVILVFAFGFVADGWQPDNNQDDNSGDNDGTVPDDDKADEDKDNENDPNEETTEPDPTVPKYVNRLTGLETTEQIANKIPTAFVIDSASALYGISSADMLVEIPTENGETRFLLFTSDTLTLGKIGSISATRGYISAISKNFGAVMVSYGSDDQKSYPTPDVSASHFDLSKYTGYHYTEYSKFAYTNGDLINNGLANSTVGKLGTVNQILPFFFNDFESEKITGELSAREVTLPYAENRKTELKFSEIDGLYTISKAEVAIHDMLNDKTPKFENVLILFADSATYETKDGVHFIMDTVGSGEGYYITGGTKMPISWTATASGELSLYNENGERLTVNRGTSYVGFFKSSEISKVEIK